MNAVAQKRTALTEENLVAALAGVSLLGTRSAAD